LNFHCHDVLFISPCPLASIALFSSALRDLIPKFSTYSSLKHLKAQLTPVLLQVLHKYFFYIYFLCKLINCAIFHSRFFMQKTIKYLDNEYFFEAKNKQQGSSKAIKKHCVLFLFSLLISFSSNSFPISFAMSPAKFSSLSTDMLHPNTKIVYFLVMCEIRVF